ncbi:hypothetical protein VTJ83DRAFT_2948 [Remersonia thermophila]|uniref:Uncharacterized protein n=1 Tax=Remersonia thermophila TaxID=72144 RepID=A0ABR4DCM5_9PEZI
MEGQRRTCTQPSPKSERWGPEIYLHVEFRMSWGKKQQRPPQNHQLTYRSRGLRDRDAPFPRQVPAPNTNYLAAIRNFEEQRRSRVQGAPPARAANDPLRHHQMQEYYQVVPSPPPPPPPPPPLPQAPILREPQRPTRASARPTHERGRSAPPPIGENPWDVSVSVGVPPLPARHSDLASPSALDPRGKPLPAPPSQFRLGEGCHPWSAWSVPDGFDPDASPGDDDDGDDDHDHDVHHPGRRTARRGLSLPLSALAPPPRDAVDRNSAAFATSPAMVSTFSPEPAAGAADANDAAALREPEPEPSRLRARELGALSAAMMTVDNGFESQWWFQGKRDTMGADGVHAAGGEGSPSGAVDPGSPRQERRERDEERDGSPVPMSATAGPLESPMMVPSGVVSPLSDAAFSPAQVPASLVLHRSMSTRSEELWFRER